MNTIFARFSVPGSMAYLVLFSCLLAGCPAAPDDPGISPSVKNMNRVKNGDMENAADAEPEHWKGFDFGGSPPGTHDYVFDPGTRNHSISVALDKPGASGWHQKIELDPDSHWIMSCRVKTENIAGRGLGATLFFPVFRYMQPPALVSAPDWTYISKELVNAGFTTLDLTCTLGAYGGNTGKAWFDDVAIVKQDNPALDPGTTAPLEWGRFSVRYNLERGYLTSLRVRSADHGDPASSGSAPPGSPENRSAGSETFPEATGREFLGSYPTLPYLNHDRDHFLGDVALDIRQGDRWQRRTTADDGTGHTVTVTENGLETAHIFPDDSPAPTVVTAWEWTGDTLVYRVTLDNSFDMPLTIGSVDLPLPWSTNYCLFNPHDKASQKLLYTRRVAEHKHVGGVSSYIMVSPMDGTSPHLLVTPGDAASGIEFTCHSPDTIQERQRDPGHWIHGAWPGLTRIFFHSEGAVARNGFDKWFFDHTSMTLAAGESRTFTLHIRPLPRRSDLPEMQAQSGGLGLRLIPGPALPAGETLTALVYGGTPPFTVDGPSVSPATVTELTGKRHRRIIFSLTAPGEQTVTIRDGNGLSASMVLMGLDPVDAMLERRTDFISENQLYRKDNAALSGGILCWNNRAGAVLAEPGDMWGSGGYEGGVTDAQFMAMKNVLRPDPAEIRILETYIHDWLLGKIQDAETHGVAWTVARPGRTERGYNYIHVLNLYDAMARAAAVWPDAFTNDAEHYMDLWFDTFKAFNSRSVRFRDLGLMGRGNIVHMPSLFRRFGREMEASQIENEIAQWVEYWVTPPAYPYGSELFFDNTGYETVALYCDYDLRHNRSLTPEQKATRRELAAQTIAVTEAGRGRAPDWFWCDSDQRWWDAVRTSPKYESFTDFGENCHHYMTGLNGYMLLELYDRGYNRDEPYPVGFSGLLTHLGRITDTGFAGMCYCPDPSSDNYGLNQFTGDVGLGLWGGILGLRCYVYDDPDAGLQCLGGRISDAGPNTVTVQPWPGCDHRMRWFSGPEISWDTEGLVIRSVTRKENGNRWIVEMENPGSLESRSRLAIQGLTPGTWSITWSGDGGKNLDSTRMTVSDAPLEFQRKTPPGASLVLVMALEV